MAWNYDLNLVQALISRNDCDNERDLAAERFNQVRLASRLWRFPALLTASGGKIGRISDRKLTGLSSLPMVPGFLAYFGRGVLGPL